MLKMLATLGIVSVTTIAFAQTPLQWTTPMQVNATAGTDWPRLQFQIHLL